MVKRLAVHMTESRNPKPPGFRGWEPRELQLFDPPALGEDAHPLVRATSGQEVAPVVGVGVAFGVQHFDRVQNAAPAANEQMAHLFVPGR